MTRKKLWWIAGAVVLLLAVGAVWFTVTDQPDDISEVFDVKNAEFYQQEAGFPTEKVRLSDGRYDPDGSDGPHVKVVEKPLFTDMDLDGDRDAVAILGLTGSDGWRGVFIWLWQDGRIAPLKWMGAWQYDCVTKTHPNAVELEGLAATGSANTPDYSELPPYGVYLLRPPVNSCEAVPRYFGRILTSVIVYNGVPVAYPGRTISLTISNGAPVDDGDSDRADVPSEWNIGAATTECLRDSTTPDDDAVAVADDTALRLVPDDDAPTVVSPSEHPVEKTYVWAPEPPDPELLKLRNGYVPATVVWEDGESGCAWVRWEDVR